MEQNVSISLVDKVLTLCQGYFSLTQANFHNRSGVHYGQDSYDERVQATRKM